MQRRVLYIANNCPQHDSWKHEISFELRLLEAKIYVTHNLHWPMRNPATGEFFWPLKPDLEEHWSVYATDSSGELEGSTTTEALTRALDKAPATGAPCKRQLRFVDGPSEKIASRRQVSLPPIKTFLERSSDTYPIPTHITTSSATKPH